MSSINPENQRRVVLLGATGSIGRQACDLFDRYPERFELVGAVAGHDVAALTAVIERFGVASARRASWQDMRGEDPGTVARLVLTGSVGPFRARPLRTSDEITVDEALRHPNWSMGPKVTIDSATMMNKGLELIEAHFLFD